MSKHTGIILSVSAIVLLGLSLFVLINPMTMERWRAEFSREIPMFPGAEFIADQGLTPEGLGIPPWIVDYRANYKVDPTTPPEAIATFYQSALPERGWKKKFLDSDQLTYYKKIFLIGERTIGIDYDCYADQTSSSSSLGNYGKCAEGEYIQILFHYI